MTVKVTLMADEQPGLVRPETLTEVVARHIRDRITEGGLAPGSPLREVHLAEQLGTSRGTVRDAIRMLADDGLVEVFPHRGAFVAALSLARVRDLYELKLQLEPLATRQGVETGALLTEDVRQDLMNHVQQMRAAAHQGDFRMSVHHEREIHEILWSHGRNTLALSYLHSIHLQTKQILTAARSEDQGTLEWDADFHAALVDAALSGDPQRAEEAAIEHLTFSRDRLLQRLAEKLAD